MKIKFKISKILICKLKISLKSKVYLKLIIKIVRVINFHMLIDEILLVEVEGLLKIFLKILIKKLFQIQPIKYLKILMVITIFIKKRKKIKLIN